MKNQAEVHALLIKIAEAFDRLAAVIGADDVPNDWEARGEPNPYIFDPLSAKADFVTPRSWGYAPGISKSHIEWLNELPEMETPPDDLPKESVIFCTDNLPEDGVGPALADVVLDKRRGNENLMLDEWPECDPDVLKDIRDKLNPLLVKRFEGMNTGEVYDALQQDVFEQAIMKLSDEEIAVLKTVWKVED
jgi:hypothetical protein